MKTLSVLAVVLSLAVPLPATATPPTDRSTEVEVKRKPDRQRNSHEPSRGMTNREKKESAGPAFVPWHTTPDRQPRQQLWHCDQSRFNDDGCAE